MKIQEVQNMMNSVFMGLLSNFLGEVAKTSLERGEGINIPTPTFGGQVFWNTIGRNNGWTMQQNMMTGHVRILNPNGIRVAWGAENVMRAKFVEISGCCYY